MGKPFVERLEGPIYRCLCSTPLAQKEALLSKSFHARSGKAYLFLCAANVKTGAQEERMMTTGMHLVSDIFCVTCCSCVGWRYDFAFEKAQKYKEGKFILERSLLIRTHDVEQASGQLDYHNSDSGEDS